MAYETNRTSLFLSVLDSLNAMKTDTAKPIDSAIPCNVGNPEKPTEINNDRNARKRNLLVICCFIIFSANVLKGHRAW